MNGTETRISSFNPANDSLDSGLIGEYNGLAVRNGIIHPVWTNIRDGHQDTYTAVWDTSSSAPRLRQHPLAGMQIGGLLDASPNPFNSAIEVRLDIPKAGSVKMAVYDLAGRRVVTLADGVFPVGALKRIWHPEGPSGIYLIRAVSPVGEVVKKLLYLK
jgi:hypothetical protein